MRANGFTLIEVLVAMGTAFVLIVGGAELVTCSLAAMRKGDATAALTQAVVDRLESLKALPFEDPALAPGDHADTVSPGSGRFRIVLEWRVETAGERMKMVSLRAKPLGRPGPGARAVLFASRDLGFAP